MLIADGDATTLDRPPSPQTPSPSTFKQTVDALSAPGGGGSGQAPNTVLFGREPQDATAISPDDIHQNGYGDCYLDSSMGELALRDPSAIQHMIHDNGDGTFTVTLHKKDNGLTNLWSLFGDRYADETEAVTPGVPAQAINQQQPDPVSVNGKHELWPQLIEEAFAKQQGGYPAIANGGWPSNAMESLTGQDASEKSPGSYGFDQLSSDVKSGKLIVVNTPPTLPSTGTPTGIVLRHAYMVVGVTSTQAGPVVTLRNPWGRGTSGGVPETVNLSFAQMQHLAGSISVGSRQ